MYTADTMTCFAVISEHLRRYYEYVFKTSGRDILRNITERRKCKMNIQEIKYECVE
jgi:hypothetical protein